MGYSREEQETTIVFDNSTGQWHVYSTVPKHIRKLLKITELFVLESENGKPIAVKGVLSEKQVNMKQASVRVFTEEQRQAAAIRLAEARASKGERL